MNFGIMKENDFWHYVAINSHYITRLICNLAYAVKQDSTYLKSRIDSE